MDKRLSELTQWVTDQMNAMGFTTHSSVALSAVSGDASFRRYFRGYGDVNKVNHGFIVMDAPPEKESSESYIKIAKALEQWGLHVPHIHAVNLEKGYLLLSDLGDELYLNHLNEATANDLYTQALHGLVRIQQCSDLAGELPLYDASLLAKEMDLFPEWFCEKLLHASLGRQEQTLIHHTMQQLIDSALAQPQVCVHRDYHSRNLMLVTENSPGILDFQDAVKGPITYDLVSLLKDCYISWSREKVQQWALLFANQLREKKLLVDVSDEQFLRWFDWMGVQRHLKVLGIFSRLHLRDHKPRYLHDIPLVLEYVLETTSRYDELHEFHQWLNKSIFPHWENFYQHEVITS
jgi:N-acetylmuramate 1-kinase